MQSQNCQAIFENGVLRPLTHLLESDSPGIDAGVNSLLPPEITTDQRGLPCISGVRVATFIKSFCE